MAVTDTPVFAQTPIVAVGQTITTANTAKDGTGTVVTAYTAGSNGSLVGGVRFRAKGTNTASVARIFVNNGSDPTNAANNTLFDEVTLPATTLSEVAATAPVEWAPPQRFVLPSGYRITVTIGTTVAAGYAVTGYGQDL